MEDDMFWNSLFTGSGGGSGGVLRGGIQNSLPTTGTPAEDDWFEAEIRAARENKRLSDLEDERWAYKRALEWSPRRRARLASRYSAIVAVSVLFASVAQPHTSKVPALIVTSASASASVFDTGEEIGQDMIMIEMSHKVISEPAEAPVEEIDSPKGTADEVELEVDEPELTPEPQGTDVEDEPVFIGSVEGNWYDPNNTGRPTLASIKGKAGMRFLVEWSGTVLIAGRSTLAGDVWEHTDLQHVDVGNKDILPSMVTTSTKFRR